MRVPLVAVAALAVCGVALVGCTGSIGGAEGTPRSDGAGGGPPIEGAAVDPGRVGMHRLNNLEYNNTVRDLFGSSADLTQGFLNEEDTFDNNAAAFGMTTAQYRKYLGAASTLMAEVMASDAERGRFMSCTPAAAADPCARKIIETFGMQIYRRPLETAEVDRAMRVYDADFARFMVGTEAIEQALTAMLSAANFLYRIEYDPAPNSTAVHPLSGYELASRLSYMNWSSMPDAALSDAAKSGQIFERAFLESTVDRMLADTKASSFIESFAGQWLGIRKLLVHSVVPEIFPSWSTELADSMIGEGHLWFEEFLKKDRPISEWFTADFNFVNDALAKNYNIPAPGSPLLLVRVEVPTDQRQGFLGLASFLTTTSVPSRTAPTVRGSWLLGQLLCDAPPEPPPNIPKLDETPNVDDAGKPAGAINVREKLEQHRTDPSCAVCHNLMDPIGLGLERFDGIGSYREAYPNGDAIVTDGVMPDGTKFASPQELGTILAKDPRFSACVAKKMLTYSLGREVEAAQDAATMQKLQSNWSARGLTFRNLMKEVVLTDAFRFSRGELE